MGFNKRYLPEVEELGQILITMGADMFYKVYVISPDALIGPSSSIDFINEFAKEYLD